MTCKTTLQKLERLKAMIEAETQGGYWRVNPHGHPHPTLPPQEYLEGPYLEAIRASTPELAQKVSELITLAGKEREISISSPERR